MILTIRKIGDPILEKVCRAINNPLKHKRLIKDMIETAKVHKAAGLAANQVGESVRIFVYLNPSYFYTVVINPEISFEEGFEVGEEGCLSVPKITALVKRHRVTKMLYVDSNGEKVSTEAVGWLACVWQHECQHLQGELFLEHAEKIIYNK